MQKMHDRKNVGKIVLDPSLEPKPKPATPAKGKAKSIDKEDKKKSEDESNESPPPSAGIHLTIDVITLRGVWLQLEWCFDGIVILTWGSFANNFLSGLMQ